MIDRSMHTGFSTYFSPADQAHVRWLARNKSSLLSHGSVDYVSGTGATEDDVDAGEESSSVSLAEAIDAWFGAKRSGSLEDLQRAGRWAIEANDIDQRVLGIEPVRRMPLPREIVEKETDEVAQLPRSQRPARLASLIENFDDDAKEVVARQVVRHMFGHGLVSNAEEEMVDPRVHGNVRPPAAAKFDGAEGSVNQAARSLDSTPTFASFKSGAPPTDLSQTNGCELVASCPTNERLTCTAHQRWHGDFAGEGYGKVTRRGWLWDDHPTVKYGCYWCTSETGKRCGFSGPGKPGTQDLYGVVTREFYNPNVPGGAFGSAPVGAVPFTIDPRRPNDYPPEMFQAIRRGIKSCQRAGTCPIQHPPARPD